MKTQMINIILNAVKIAVKLAISALFAYAAYLLFTPLALLERGYFAIGGEGLISIIVFAGTYYALDKIDNIKEVR